MLKILDAQWKEHLHTMDALREAVGLRGYAQKDPKIEYQREGFEQFEVMEERVDMQASEMVFKFGFPKPRLESAAQAANQSNSAGRVSGRPAGAPVGAQASGGGRPLAKIGRNDPCTCGSGKKYKKCCGA